jgi:hypothetical protein
VDHLAEGDHARQLAEDALQQGGAAAAETTEEEYAWHTSINDGLGPSALYCPDL